MLGKRLEKFGLHVAPDKTQLLEFKNYEAGKTRFDFLGFEFRWAMSRKGKYILAKRTSRKKLHASICNVQVWLKENRHERLPVLVKMLNRKLSGYYNYYGVIGNSASYYGDSYPTVVVALSRLMWKRILLKNPVR